MQTMTLVQGDKTTQVRVLKYRADGSVDVADDTTVYEGLSFWPTAQDRASWVVGGLPSAALQAVPYCIEPVGDYEDMLPMSAEQLERVQAATTLAGLVARTSTTLRDAVGVVAVNGAGAHNDELDKITADLLAAKV